MHCNMYIIKSNNIPLSEGPTFLFIVCNQANTYKVESAGALEIWSKHY
jgi:hypothetical protein